MNKKWWLIIIPFVLLAIYLAGPAPKKPLYKKDLPAVPSDAVALERYIAEQEAQHKLRPDNEARIVWNDSSRQPTEYSIVYLHGFSASQAEGEPVHRDIAREFGCNLYLSRLAEHGIDTSEQLVNLTVDKYWESALQAYAIGRKLGHKVILMGTSTGGTLALQLAAAYPDIAAVVLMSPNIAINDPNAWLLNNHWGLQIARSVVGSKYIVSEDTAKLDLQYWNHPYRLEAAAQLEELIETSMNGETFRKVKQPVELLYFYKDEIHQDSTVKVSAMKEMFSELGTPAAQKRAVAMPNAGTHVIGSYIRSNDVMGVEREIRKFLKEVVMSHQ